MIKSNSEKKCKASKSEFEPVWSGLKQCMVCGFTLATFDSSETITVNGRQKPKYPKEDTLHSTYHGKFYKCCSEYGSSNVLTYKLLKELSENMPTYLSKLKDNDVLEDIVAFPKFLNELNENVCNVLIWLNPLGLSDDIVSKEFYNSLILTIKRAQEYYFTIVDLYKNPSISNISCILSEYKKITECYIEIFNTLLSLRYTNMGVDMSLLDFSTLPFDLDAVSAKLNAQFKIVPTKLSCVDDILQKFFSVEFTKSLRLWDMCKPHPKFDDYVTLLWNTPKFLEFIKVYMTELQYTMFVNSHICNRQLVDKKFNEAPYYFGQVMESDVCSKCRENINNCSSCGSIEQMGSCSNCKNCVDCSVIDLSYIDSLIEVPDEDELDTSVEDDYEDTERNFEAFSKLFNSSLNN